MTLPTKAELLAIFEQSPDAVVIVDVANDRVTAANAVARTRLGISVGASPADTSLLGDYLSLSSLAAAGLRGSVAGQRVQCRGALLEVTTVELATESEAAVAVIMRDRTDTEAALAAQSIHARLDLARSVALGLATRLLDPCVVLSADLEFIEESHEVAERAAALAEARQVLQVLIRTVTALRELALPDEASDGAPVAPALEAATALAEPELRGFARLVVEVAPGAAAAASRPLLALMLFHVLWWIGERLRAEHRDGTELRVTVRADDARVTIELRHAASPLRTLDGSAAAAVLESMVRSAGGRLMEGGEAGSAWTQIQLPASAHRSSARHVPRADVLVSPATVAPRAAGSSRPPPSRRTRVLLVDDDDSIRAALGRLLGSEYDVVVASHAQGAIRALEESLPDVVVSDVAMPGTNGPALMHLAVARWPQIEGRFLFLTGGSIEPAAQRAIAEARVPCLLKPVGRAGLIEAIEEILATAPRWPRTERAG